MATTRIISMHVNKGKTVAACLTERTDYATNPEKTDKGELVTAYACDPHTADSEFLFAKRQYKTITGREQSNDVIAYQVRQSFKPGEITPEEANKVGYEFASRFLKGKHAFIVATHTDRLHVHNHIVWNSTTLDCAHKFRDFLGSGRAVARLSDVICMEHRLSVIEQPKRYVHGTYDKWLGPNAMPSNREVLRSIIDAALAQKPKDFDAFLKLIEAEGYTIKRGANITLCRDGQKNIRLGSLGDGYSEEEIRAVLAGEKTHTPRKRRTPVAKKKNQLLIDIQAKMAEGKGIGFERWATNANLKQMAQTVLYIEENAASDYNELAARSDAATARFNELSAKIKAAEKRMAEIAVLRTHIINYSKTRDVYAGYRTAGYSKKYLAEHESDIIIHKAAKKAFDELGLKKLPTVKSLQTEYAALLTEKKEAYADYHQSQKEMRELIIHKKNIEMIFGIDDREQAAQRKENEHDRQ